MDMLSAHMGPLKLLEGVVFSKALSERVFLETGVRAKYRSRKQWGKGKILIHGKPDDVTARLEGAIYSKIIDRGELGEYETNYQVLFSTLVGGRTRIHIVSEEDPGNDFVATPVSLEDVYFSTLREHQIQIAA